MKWPKRLSFKATQVEAKEWNKNEDRIVQEM